MKWARHYLKIIWTKEIKNWNVNKYINLYRICHFKILYTYIYILAVIPKRYTGIDRYPKYIVSPAKPVQHPVRYWHPWLEPNLRIFNCVKLASSKGIGLLNRLKHKLRIVNRIMFVSSKGILLVNWLKPKIRIVSFVRFASPKGIGPVKWLEPKVRIVNCVRFASPKGIWPVNRLMSKLRMVKSSLQA